MKPLFAVDKKNDRFCFLPLPNLESEKKHHDADSGKRRLLGDTRDCLRSRVGPWVVLVGAVFCKTTTPTSSGSDSKHKNPPSVSYCSVFLCQP